MPMPWLSEAESALDDVHFSVADLPRSIELGSAEMLIVGRAGAGFSAGGGGGAAAAGAVPSSCSLQPIGPG
ncbi:MAG: hypothetical protein R2748_10645 [Bryobacterales bacterium]